MLKKKIYVLFQTCLASRYCHDEFTRQYFPTAGVDFFLKRTVLSGAGNITLQIWDVGGQSLAGNMLDKYVYGADVSKQQSYTLFIVLGFYFGDLLRYS
jgi:hypothetical protein